ncbi:MAG TPA: SDR family NAD(P)-dependent oxidoreductase [Alphaproteobacteria bacterium]|nr:SDR family NAD(P)-dependent oxidoreductase [Alphaproteobacteria bacterium]
MKLPGRGLAGDGAGWRGDKQDRGAGVIGDIKGRGAVVTGAASGIGLGIARAMAARGVKLFLADIDAEALARIKAGLMAGGGAVETIVLDVSDRAAVKEAAAHAADFLGAIHILCNNAGVGYAGVPLDAVPDEDWDWVVGVNLMGVINGLQAFLPRIEGHGQGGHIVNTASIGGHHVMPGWGHGVYSTTKYAVVGLSEALKDDLKDKNIGVSVLCPAAVDTAIYESGRHRPDRYGGPFERPFDHDLPALLKAGMAPIEIGRWVIRAIEDDAFYIFTHPATREFIDRRYKRIDDAYAWAARMAPDIERQRD